MKSSKSFLLCLLAGLFISANCAALNLETTDKTEDVAVTTIALPTTKSDPTETTTVNPVTNSTTDPIPTNTTTTVTPETTTTSTTTSTSSTTTPASTTTTTSSTTSSTTPSPNFTTTTTPVPSSSTTTTEIPSTTAAPPVPCHRFDGSSFVGGIVLTLGLLAISLVAYKFYKARNERNYHTL